MPIASKAESQPKRAPRCSGAFFVDERDAIPLRKDQMENPNAKSPDAKPASFLDESKANLKIVLDGAPVVFEQGRSAIVQQRNPEWPGPTAWTIGCSLNEAKLLVELLPDKHIRKTVMRYQGETTVLADVTDITAAAWDALFAWQVSSGECGPVKLVPAAEHPANSEPFIGKELFFAALVEQPAVFSNEPVLVEQASGAFKFPTQWSIGSSQKQVQLIAAALPKAHVRKLHLQTIGKDVILADVTQFSVLAFAVVATWLNEGAPASNLAIIRKLKAVVDGAKK